ncbi:ABC transporter permease [Isoptericola sp. b441]|uniref:ABC transporter permease n=1 Tax=Actinotalea lenta TaxID=3064654 RepID=A0ABT9D6Q1_9CELL|nr:ABC transporter permease [Isoptericola sp. b441]MDO8106517.1 ABC transporter permease [Isoptericola sp. b441]
MSALAPARPDARALRWLPRLNKRFLIDYMAWVLLLALALIGVATNGSLFASGSNLNNIVEQSVIIGLLAIGQFVVILTGGIDLSVGSAMALTAMVVGVSMPLGTPGAVLMAVLTGTLVGLASGLTVVYGGLPPFIVTFAMMAVARGLALTITSGKSVQVLDNSLLGLGFGWQKVAVWALAIAVVWFILTRTRTGVRVYAVGGNVEAARVSGISTPRVIVLVYVISGLCAATAGILSFARNGGVAVPTSGQGYEMETIAAVVLGGVNLLGGEGRFVGAIAGTVFVVMLRNILDLSNADAFWSFCVIGVVLWGAVMLRGALERMR